MNDIEKIDVLSKRDLSDAALVVVEIKDGVGVDTDAVGSLMDRVKRAAPDVNLLGIVGGVANLKLLSVEDLSLHGLKRIERTA